MEATGWRTFCQKLDFWPASALKPSEGPQRLQDPTAASVTQGPVLPRVRLSFPGQHPRRRPLGSSSPHASPLPTLTSPVRLLPRSPQLLPVKILPSCQGPGHPTSLAELPKFCSYLLCPHLFRGRGRWLALIPVWIRGSHSRDGSPSQNARLLTTRAQALAHSPASVLIQCLWS